MDETKVRDARAEVADALGRRTEQAAAMLRSIPPGALAAVLPELAPEQAAAVLHLVGGERAAEVMAELSPEDAARLLLQLSRREAAVILAEMDPDDATDVVEELPPAEAENLLGQMEATEAEDVRTLLGYPPESAGGVMTPEFVAVSPDLTADEALQAIRRVAEEAETIYYVYVTDESNRLLGVLSLRDLVLAHPETPIERLMNPNVVKVAADADREQAARLLAQYGFLAVPVVDAENRLVGIVTSDDVADILEEEATEDIARLGGSEPLEAPYLRVSVLDVVKKRVVWLLLLFVTGAFTANVLSYFEETLDRVVALAFFIPLLIGTGGNVGSQTVTTIVRAMAVGEIGYRDATRVLLKEMAVGLLLGVGMAVPAIVRAATLGVSVDIGLTVAVTVVVITTWAATVGALLPLLLRRLGADPAVVSAPLISTLVDATGLFIYLSLARLLVALP